MDVFDVLKLIYKNLNRNVLLALCMDEFMQNSNKSFNSFWWGLTPKRFWGTYTQYWVITMDNKDKLYIINNQL